MGEWVPVYYLGNHSFGYVCVIIKTTMRCVGSVVSRKYSSRKTHLRTTRKQYITILGSHIVITVTLSQELLNL